MRNVQTYAIYISITKMTKVKHDVVWLIYAHLSFILSGSKPSHLYKKFDYHVLP